jgi:ComF family protein
MTLISKSRSAVTSLAELTADFLFPRLCCGCGDRISERKKLVCGACMNRIHKLPTTVCTRCGAPDVPIVHSGSCKRCMDAIGGFDQIRSASTYSDVSLRIIQKFKYSRRTEYGELIADYMRPPLEDAGWRYDLVTWVPLHATRQRERGFNQSQILAESLLATTPGPPCIPLLKRIRPTKSQAHLKRRERLTNLKGAFALLKNADVRGKTILIVDDVCTTGSTINECAKTLKQEGAVAIYGLTFARASDI